MDDRLITKAINITDAESDVKSDKPLKSGNKVVLRDPKTGRLLPGTAAIYPAGRPKGSKSMKDFVRQMFQKMTDEQKTAWLNSNLISAETIWKMGEGNPEQKVDSDITITKEILEYADNSDGDIITDRKDEVGETQDETEEQDLEAE